LASRPFRIRDNVALHGRAALPSVELLGFVIVGCRVADQPSTSSGHRARLRQRLFDGGGKALLDHELVEYLLALAIPRRDTKAQAKALIARFGGIGALLEAGPDVLRKEGLSEGVIGALQIARATALRLLETRIEGRPVLSSWDALGDYLQAAMAHSSVEEVRVLFLNAKNMLLANEAMWRGSVDEASVHVREVISRAIALGATAIIIVHNHPSGDPSPSQQDIRLTRDLIEAGRHMKVTVHDHVIVGARGRSSMKAMGLI
jgi:DNA repair protein RadC